MIIGSLVITGDYDFALSDNPDLRQTLDQVKLWEIYQRIAGQEFSEMVGHKLIDMDINKHISINHQKATMDFYFDWDHTKIGIQIEDDQYRKFVFCKDGDKVIEKLIANRLWFNDTFTSRGKHKKFGGFDMGAQGFFAYQYDMDFKNNSKRTQNAVIEMIRNDLQFLAKNKNFGLGV